MNEIILKGELLDEQVELTLRELCDACSIQTEWVIELIDEGILEPAGDTRNQWRFTAISLSRAQTAMRLQRDLGINIEGVALALELLDEIDELKTRLSRFEKRFF